MGDSRVLIAGGGVAGLETALALRDIAGQRVEIEMHSPQDEFLYRPFAVGVPFGAAVVTRYELAALAGRGDFTLRRNSIAAVDGEARRVTTRDGQSIEYDHLVLACGARMLWTIPGAVTFWGVADDGGAVQVIEELRAGNLTSAVFTMPSGCSWALPLYELALQASTELSKSGVGGTRLAIVTPEDAPLQVFGQHASSQMSEMLADRDIEVLTGAHPVKVENGRLHVVPDDQIEADVVVAMPHLEGHNVDGVPQDDEGFVGIDDHCRVAGMERVFAAGDLTAFPVKQGGIATQQADAAAEAIAVEVGGISEARPFQPVLRGVLWTGEEPRYLYGKLTGGHGETSSFSDSPPWSGPEGKIVGRHLTPFLAAVDEAT